MAPPKIVQPSRPVSRDSLLLWVMHRFATVFGEHAILRGGMALRLLDSVRYTNDIDFVFVPFSSKRTLAPALQRILAELQDASVTLKLHSTLICAEVILDGVAVQVEATVAKHCASTPMATRNLAAPLGQLSHIVRIMEPSVALAHKLAAWNERRLVRDLYDVHFLVSRTRVMPDLPILNARLKRFQSRLPHLRRQKSMTLQFFLSEIDKAAQKLTHDIVQADIGGLIEATELVGLALRMRSSLNKLTEQLNHLQT